MFNITKEELKKRALSVVQIPHNFFPLVEEYGEGKYEEMEAMFIWADQEQDKGISINLDSEGNLTRLSMDLEHKVLRDVTPLDIEERRKRAEEFLFSHYPDALRTLTYYEAKKIADDAYRFYFEQIVMDLPLRDAGCFIDVDPRGNIVTFDYSGIKELPVIPKKLISKERLKEDMQNKQDFELKITYLYSDISAGAEEGLRLVYEPKLYTNYKADVLEPTFTIVHDEDDPETYVSLPPVTETKAYRDLPIEDIIGITEKMEIIREVDMGEATGIVWRDRDWKMAEQDLSMEGLLKRQIEGTVKAFIIKETGRLRGFMWFDERKGDLQLCRSECYQKAVEFFQLVIPEYYQFLKLIVHVNEEVEQEEHETSSRESFIFHIHNSQGISIQDTVMVGVNRTTGKIDHYRAPSYAIKQLSQVPTIPVITKGEASKIFFDNLGFELAWKKDYDRDEDSYRLVYQACDRHTRTSIRYIDAMTGAVISNLNY